MLSFDWVWTAICALRPLIDQSEKDHLGAYSQAAHIYSNPFSFWRSMTAMIDLYGYSLLTIFLVGLSLNSGGK
jgi:hypothetical protein